MAEPRRIALSPGGYGSRPSEAAVRGLNGADILMLLRSGSSAPASRARMLAEAVGAPGDARRLPWPDVERILIACFAETFGSNPELVADCRVCGLRFELKPDLSAMLDHPPSARGSVRLPSPRQACSLRFRAPTAVEMERAASLTPDRAAEALRRVVVVELDRSDGVPDGPDVDDPEMREAIDLALSEANAAGHHLINTACPDCGEEVICRLDPLALIEAEAARHDVARDAERLSTALGWTIDRALALPEARRRALVAALVPGGAA
jgi:hypothetical protein